MTTTYISIDIEADGKIPGFSSMLSFGAAAFQLDEHEACITPIDTFEANLVCLHDLTALDGTTPLFPHAKPSENTMAWWATQGEAWATCRKNIQDPAVAMPKFVEWVRALPGKVVVVGFPVTYDFMFLAWYTVAFGGLADGERSPIGFSGFDIKTLAATQMNVPFHKATKRNMPKRWFKGAPKHNHEALTDAIGQGVLFVNIMKEYSK